MGKGPATSECASPLRLSVPPDVAASRLHRAPSLGASGGAFPIDAGRLFWLVRLRWHAVFAMLVASGIAAFGAVPGVAWKVVLGTAGVLAAFNVCLWWRHRRRCPLGDTRGVVAHAIGDLVALTVALWAAGGLDGPFVAFYVFHVALVAILAGARASMLTAVASLAAAGFLALTEVVPGMRIGRWDPLPPFDVLAEVTAVLVTVVAIAYLVNHCVRALRERETALAAARDQAELEYQLLSATLNELEAGLEVVDPEGQIVWRNRRAELLAPRSSCLDEHWRCPGEGRPCEKDASGVCPMQDPRSRTEAGRCRFSAVIDGEERVYELMSFPLAGTSGQRARLMNLYIDRTSATLAERRLLLAERLASLGRVAQGVAHELNTPLSTIRTLAADIRSALRAMQGEDPSARDQVIADIDESASMVQDETRRLGRITQSLLAGGDLVRARIDGSVPLAAVVERARALVLAGVRGGPSVEVLAEIDELTVTADPDRLTQVLVNLLQNAVDAIRGHKRGGKVVIAARRTEPHVELIVEDDGPGLDPRMEGRLFEPFATTKPPGQGTGLGLYTSYMLVQNMGGVLALERREEGGTRAIVRLPPSAARQDA
ncbi:MAG: HAMP domain-containing histidine kinase, partial [Deltaproteobacteria bacterium]|nr:HAMP domain-containing histidine kinase [Deltaproteobacteria bacterium]